MIKVIQRKTLFILALLVVVYLGFQPQWHYTLSGDIRNYYYPLSQHIFTSQTLIYPPGANLFFLSLPAFSIGIYEWSLVAANIFLVTLLWFLTKKPLVLTLLLLAAGPIVLFRFDLLVVVLTAISLVAFQKARYLAAGTFLGLAVATKIFPIVLLPYLFLVLPKGKRIAFLITFILAIALVLGAYFIVTQQSLSTVVASFYFNFSKSVHMESVLSSALTIITSFTNPGPHGVEFTGALWVISPLYLLGHARIFRFVSLTGLVFIYLLILFLWRKKTFNISVCLLLVLTLIITSQALSPQYVLWPAFLLLLAPSNKINLFLILLALVCTQIVYPLNYGELIDFYNLGKNQWIFGILVLRNAALVILTVRPFRYEIVQILPKKGPTTSI